jgi:nucleotide-binding universal stress UspA family protein
VFRSIVVGTDGSETAGEAVRQATELARLTGGRIHLVSAYEPVGAARLREERERVPADLEWMVNPREDVDRTLSEASSAISDAGVDVTVYARHMMKAHYFGHAGRIQASRRFRTVGEILEMHRGYGARTSAALKAWGNSPGHRAIILDSRFRYVGAGVFHGKFQGHRMTFWVMHFGT